ncbi:hypothetical protein ES705_48411 [subsurface metagenome]
MIGPTDLKRLATALYPFPDAFADSIHILFPNASPTVSVISNTKQRDYLLLFLSGFDIMPAFDRTADGLKIKSGGLHRSPV